MSKTLIRLCLLLILVVCLSPFANAAQEVQKPERWSVERTVQYAKENPFAEAFSVTDVFRDTPLNPDARAEMYRILNDSNQSDVWGRVTRYFGLIAQMEDVPKLLELVEKRKGTTLDGREESMIFDIISVMSMLECRGMKGAGEIMDKMITPDYWQQLDIKYTHGDFGARPAVARFSGLAVYAKNYSGDPKAKEKVQAICEKIQDPNVKKEYEYQVKTMSGAYDAFMAAKQANDWTLYYGKREAKPSPTPSLEVFRKHPDFAYEEFYTSTTLWTIPAKLDPTVEEELCKEALVAFNATLEVVVKRDEKYLVMNTAVAGRPLLLKEEQTTENAEKIHAKMPELKKKWQNLVPLAQAFQGKALSPAQHFVQLQAGFAINNVTGGSLEAPPFVNLRKNPKAFYPFLLIRFRYDDLKDVAKKYPEIFNNKGRIPSVSETGEPYVVMIWENEQWYWNPFGM